MLISCETFRYLLSLFGVLDCIDLRSSQVPEMPLQAFFGSCEKAKQRSEQGYAQISQPLSSRSTYQQWSQVKVS